jgi:proteasome component ECM29
MASELSPEARELALVGKLELRIGLASSDKKLEDLLKLFLAPLLLKLGSESVTVRNKVRQVRRTHVYFIALPPTQARGLCAC